MPVQVDTPSNTGTSTEWGLWGSAASKIAALETDDGDTSVVFASSGGRLVLDLYEFPQLLGVVTPVTAASLSARTREYYQGGGGRGYSLYWNSVEIAVNRQQEVHVAAPNYVTVTYDATGGNLALGAVNGQHGMVFTAAGGPSSAVTINVNCTTGGDTRTLSHGRMNIVGVDALVQQ